MSVVALDARRPVLGGSTIAAACGIDPYCSPIRLWLDLTQGREREETEAMRWGKLLEPVIMQALIADGYDVAPSPRGVEWRDEERAWLVGHPDGVVEPEDDAAVLEIKTASHWVGDAAQPRYEAQVQTYMHLTGLDHALLAVLVGGQHLELHEIERKQPLIDVLLALAETFMGYVRSGEQPAPNGHPDDRAALTEVYPHASRTRTVRETKEVREARRELTLLLEREKMWKARVEHLRATITNHMADAEVLIGLHDEPVATWKNVTTRRLDTGLLKKEYPQMYADYCTETTTRRLVLS